MNIFRFFLDRNQKSTNGDHEHDGRGEKTSKKEKYERKII